MRKLWSSFISFQKVIGEFYTNKWGMILIFVSIFYFSACESERMNTSTTTTDKLPSLSTLFTTIPATYSGIDFINQADYTEEFNVYTYRNFYNGGGVALGDINNDGLVDIYFCGNILDNKLYLNQGDFKFKDITEQAGVSCPNVWSSGVSMADINGDGLLDIYVCKSGAPEGKNRYNELFINNGDLTFTEQAKEYGIGDTGLSTHAAFFDYDQDGDLDCYLLNNSFSPVTGYDLQRSDRTVRDPEGGNKLYRNDDGKYVDVSESAGIYGSAIGFGLGVTIGDVNRDGWQDIFVSNDFFEKDYLYINQQDGTFQEALEDHIREISMGSMGADMADVNNDGYPEIFVTEMLPAGNTRMKTKTAFENWDKYQLNLANGYYHQFTRNVLQLNQGLTPTATGKRQVNFSETSRLAGVHATDWSWGALIMDMDNDGWKDIFVANGIYKDLMDQDYISFYSDPRAVRAKLQESEAGILNLIEAMPSEQIPNYAFKNQGNTGGLGQPVTFIDEAKNWGLAAPSHSNGSAYGDLDNDGDLDIVVNNMNMAPFIYRNESDTLRSDRNYLTINLLGKDKNRFALGAQATLYAGTQSWYQELAPMRGFESSVDYRLHFGLGEVTELDSIIVNWNSKEQTILKNIETRQLLTIDQNKMPTEALALIKNTSKSIFTDQTASANIKYRHQENQFIDFDRDRLLYHMLSAEGPKMAKGDVNRDGREDIFIGGAKDAAGTLMIQEVNGQFRATNQVVFAKDQVSEDGDCIFFDADGDRDLDLLVGSGGNEFPSSSSALKDRLYLNDGYGNFTKSPQFFPYESTGCIAVSDYDQDGDEDIFIGSRLRPFLYGVPVSGQIMENDGKGNFTNVTQKIAPELESIGLLTDAVWMDYDRDKDLDLILVGEWMPITIFNNEKGRLRKTEVGLKESNGFWNCLKMSDLDKDGDLDLVVGNHGKNTRFRADVSHPITMYINDFDQNGTAEQIVNVYNGDTSYPFALRHDLVMQLPHLKKKYLKYEAYKNETIQDIFSPEELSNSIQLEVKNTATCIALNQGDGTFLLKELPLAAQLSPTYSVLIDDFNKDGHQDILLGGNFYRSKPEVGIYDGSYGIYLRGDGAGNFTPLSYSESGFFVKGEIRDMVQLKNVKEQLVVVARNNESIKVFRY